eukprot:scaffold50707_cov28-Phaeocystis_antarctica.AAC.1
MSAGDGKTVNPTRVDYCGKTRYRYCRATVPVLSPGSTLRHQNPTLPRHYPSERERMGEICFLSFIHKPALIVHAYQSVEPVG